ncbi:hypothetical protein [Helicobacter pylori]|nr:hypothetical protein [Helicobacter pylori]
MKISKNLFEEKLDAKLVVFSNQRKTKNRLMMHLKAKKRLKRKYESK